MYNKFEKMPSRSKRFERFLSDGREKFQQNERESKEEERIMFSSIQHKIYVQLIVNALGEKLCKWFVLKTKN